MKISDRVESIFSHAAGLQQSGRLRNTVYCEDSDIFIMNQDRTVILRFRLRDGETGFKHSVSFDASDYDSREFTEKDGRIEFTIREGEFCRTKTCKTPKHSPAEVHDIYKGIGKPKGKPVIFPEAVLGLLDEGLSHVEFSAEDGDIQLVQRNIYTGSVITVEKDKTKAGMGLTTSEVKDFGPMGMRTNDFIALFTMANAVAFCFGREDVVHVKSVDPKIRMTGVIGQCFYDELGGDDGR